MALMMLLSLILIPAFVFSIAWVWRDATRRGQPGFIVAVLAAFLFWPLSLIVWAIARPGLPGVPRNSGRQWALVVVGVLGVLLLIPVLLAIISIPSFSQGRQMAHKISRANYMHQMVYAYQRYEADNGKRPQSLDALPGSNQNHVVYVKLPQASAASNMRMPDYQVFASNTCCDVSNTIGSDDAPPSSQKTTGNDVSSRRRLRDASHNGSSCTKAKDIIIREVPDVRDLSGAENGHFVAYGDGSVEWIAEGAR